MESASNHRNIQLTDKALKVIEHIEKNGTVPNLPPEIYSLTGANATKEDIKVEMDKIESAFHALKHKGAIVWSLAQNRKITNGYIVTGYITNPQ